LQEIAVLVGLKLTGAKAAAALITAEESLEELAALADSAGAQVAERSIQTRPRADAATLVGSGKVEELKSQIAFHEASTVIFDHELSPTQQRNLEKALDVKVLDRTQLILDIFARRARTRGSAPGGAGTAELHAAAPHGEGRRDVAVGRRYRHARSRRNQA
jgi:GTP-binding protein HflX